MIDEKQFKWLKAKLAVDTMRLDEELVELPALQQQASEQAANAQRVRDEVSDIAKRVDAEVKDQMRKADPKLSEARLTSEVLLDEAVVAAHAGVIEADYELALWKTVADGIRAKSTSIRTIAELIAAGYATPDTIRQDRLHEIYGQRKGRS